MERLMEADRSKLDVAVEMIWRAWKLRIRPGYVLADSWYLSEKLLRGIIDIGKGALHFLGMAKTEELKNSATKTATAALNGINSLLGGNKVSRLEKENAQRHREIEDLNDQIERLHTDMQKMKDSHAMELTRTNEQHQQEVSN